MKKYTFLFLIFLSLPAAAAPVVRTFGGTAPVSAVGQAKKATPIRANTVKLSGKNTPVSRLGTVRPTASPATVGAITSSAVSRASVVPVVSFDTGFKPNGNTGGTTQQTTGTCCDTLDLNKYYEHWTDNAATGNFEVDVTTIVTRNLLEMPEPVPEPEEDPRIDAVRLGDPRTYWGKEGRKSLGQVSPNHVYMWIENP